MDIQLNYLSKRLSGMCFDVSFLFLSYLIFKQVNLTGRNPCSYVYRVAEVSCKRPLFLSQIRALTFPVYTILQTLWRELS